MHGVHNIKFFMELICFIDCELLLLFYPLIFLYLYTVSSHFGYFSTL
jgi:hypothetical protein